MALVVVECQHPTFFRGLMMAHTWSHKTASARIDKLLKDVETVEVVDYARDMSLENIPTNKAYKNDSVHLYIDITNIDEILENTDSEGTLNHKRTLKFLNLHYRAVQRILDKCDALKVDFHNQRLHAVIFKPYDSEEKRIKKAVAIAQLVIDVLQETGDEDDKIPSAKARVGIDSGVSLIVNNGRRQGKEPLFLGRPANESAKLASEASEVGIYLTNHARAEIGLPKAAIPKKTALSTTEIDGCKESADLDVTKDQVIKEWKTDLENNPIGAFEFSGHTPPMVNLKIVDLTPGNSRRQELISLYADISGFTKYVNDHIDSNTEDVVRTLHVIRSELDNVLSQDFEGRKIRFIGDCLHGVFCLGTAQTTNMEETISESVLCAGALRSSFDLAIEKLKDNDVDVSDLGLGIGFEYGQTAITRLGMQGKRSRCAISRAVLNAERAQSKCSGVETAIGNVAYKKAKESVRTLFTESQKTSNLDYNEAVEALAERQDESAKSAKRVAYSESLPAIIEATTLAIRPHCK